MQKKTFKISTELDAPLAVEVREQFNALIVAFESIATQQRSCIKIEKKSF